MIVSVLSLLLMWSPGGQSLQPSVQALQGAWTSTVEPPPSAMPMIPTSLSIEVAGGAVTVVQGERRAAAQAFVALGPGMSSVGATIRFKAADAANAPTVTVRPIGPDRIEVEYLFEPTGSASTGRKYVETFVRKK